MNKILSIIIGIVIFILILSVGYIGFENGISSNKKVNSKANTIQEENEFKIGDIIYKGKLPMPIENFEKVTSKFGYRQAHGVVHANHTGIDLRATIGSKILCASDGEIVTTSNGTSGYGNYVEIKHKNKDGKVFYTLYAHMRAGSIKVSKGQNVVVGQVLGIQGATGNATGDHLHFEIRTKAGSNKYAIDPAPYLFTKKEE